MIRYRSWTALLACALFAIILLCQFYLSKSRPDERAVAAAEDEVYETLVRYMFTPAHGQANTTQLVFDDTVLTGVMPGTDTKACNENVREEVRLEGDSPPYNSVADKIYRMISHGWYDDSPRSDTIQNFLKRACTGGPLSTTFHTDFPRVFINPNSVFFDIVPIDRSGMKDFQQTFPGAGGIISLSHVGLDPTLHEAIVSTSFVCGGLCGTGRVYILRKIRSRWDVIGNSIIWVS